MTTEVSTPKQEDRKTEVQVRNNSSDAVYAIGLIGAWVFYIGRAKSFQEGLLGFFKGFAWPALLVHKALVVLDDQRSE
jgi:hypothetical protein